MNIENSYKPKIINNLLMQKPFCPTSRSLQGRSVDIHTGIGMNAARIKSSVSAHCRHCDTGMNTVVRGEGCRRVFCRAGGQFRSECDIKITMVTRSRMRYTSAIPMRSDLKTRSGLFSRSCATGMAILAVLVSQPGFARSSYFEMSEKRSDTISPFPKWTGMISRYDTEKDYAAEGECGKMRFFPCSVNQWQSMLGRMKDKDFEEQLEQVNQWSNRHPYIEDQINWGLEDFWETPPEFMEISGDCEDYAISKYYSLRALGYAPQRLRIIIVQDLNLGGVIHAVLGVYDEDGELFILDNQSQQVMPALRIYHYRPIFGINESSWWAYYPVAN